MRLFAFLFICIAILSCSNPTAESPAPTHRVSSLIGDSSDILSSIDTVSSIIPASYNKAISGVVDSVKITELKNVYTEKKDEYRGITWVRSNIEPRFRSTNGIYCYFAKEGNRAFNFRFVIQYYAEDWLFIKHYRFVIDGKPYSYFPSNVERDSGYGGKIWEWFDEVVTSTDKELIEALANAKSAKMKLVGDQYYDEKTITTKQLKAIRDMYELYKAMGGTIN
jgi:hypothetical protein